MKTWIISGAACLALHALSAHAETVEEKLDRLEREVKALKDSASRPSASTAPSKTTIGGYGEISYNNYDAVQKDIADLKRFVVFLGHRFNDRTQLFSELEVEHAFVKNGNAPSQGELEMEQAYIQHEIVPGANFRGGLMLIPSGMINEYHEPPVFNGVERPEVDNRIIPTTWRELGLAMQGVVAEGLEYNVGLITMPDASLYANASQGFRGMRTGGSKTVAHDWGYYAALNWRGIPGLLLGGSVFHGDTAQNGRGVNSSTQLDNADATLTLWELHAKYSFSGIDLRALYAAGTLSDTDAINRARSITTGSGNAAPESFFGWYMEAAYHLWQSGDYDLAPFVRLERYNTQEEVAAGYSTDPRNTERVMTVGLTFRLHPQVVLKADFQDFRTDDTKDRWNLGIGYMF